MIKIKNFQNFIKENLGNIYQIGTPFSNGHRSRTKGDGFLLDRHYMIDIDKLIIDQTDNIVGVIEKKVQLPGPDSKLKNILDPNKSSVQKLALMQVCKQLGCKLFVYVEKDSEYHLIKSDFSIKTYSSDLMDKTLQGKNYKVVETDNLLFLEFRINYGKVTLKAIVERLTGSNVIMMGYIRQISEKCGGLPIVQVDDERPEMVFRLNGQIIGKVPSILYPKTVTGDERKQVENAWEEIYKKIGIFD